MVSVYFTDISKHPDALRRVQAATSNETSPKAWAVTYPKTKGEGHWYVTIRENGATTCDCPAWKFQRTKGPCKHVKDVLTAKSKFPNVVIIRGGNAARR